MGEGIGSCDVEYADSRNHTHTTTQKHTHTVPRVKSKMDARDSPLGFWELFLRRDTHTHTHARTHTHIEIHTHTASHGSFSASINFRNISLLIQASFLREMQDKKENKY